MTNRTYLRTLPLAAALALASTAIQAQQPEPAQPTAQGYEQPQATAASFSDTELQSFAKARQSVEAIRTEITSKLQNSQDPEEVQKLQEEANVKMIAAVEGTGLSRQKYNEIAQAAMSDPALAEKLSKLQ
jgi:hypothetical protein